MNENNIPAGDRGKAAGNGFHQQLVNQIAREFLLEQRRSRRWGIFFKLLLAVYLFALLLIYMDNGFDMEEMGSGRHTALIDINGIIAADAQANAENIMQGLRAAFRNSNAAGVILRINSPGGSPVQAGYINDEIHRLRDLHPDIPVYAVIMDTCASGGYYIAVAADRIFADKASLVGSIGVIMSGFGFVEAIDKLGIERRLMHAGDSKAFLDAFSPLREEDVAHVNKLLDDVYQQFIETVRQGRGDKLAENQELFSGLVWTGEQSVGLGLVDELGDTGYVAREVIGAERIVNYTPRPEFLERLTRGLGQVVAEQLLMFNYELN